MIWLIYLYGLLDNLQTLFGCALFVFTFASVIFIFVRIILYYQIHGHLVEERISHCKHSVKYAKLLIFFVLVTSVFIVLTPSQNTFAAMVLIPKIVSNKDMKELPGNAAKVLNQAVKNWSESLVDNTPDIKRFNKAIVPRGEK